MNAMKKYPNLTGQMLLLLVLGWFMALNAAQAQSATSGLNLGDILPDVSGQTPIWRFFATFGYCCGQNLSRRVFVQQDWWQGRAALE
jgi:hypothetical protein